jgi:hypothetical protein
MMEIFLSRCFGMIFCSFETMFFIIMQFCSEYVIAVRICRLEESLLALVVRFMI